MGKIIVNNLFVGSFGFDEANIPLEVINFYKSDDGNCYVYLAPRGQIGARKDEVSAILFVKTAFPGVVEIIGKAGKIKESYVDGLSYMNDIEKKVKNLPQEQTDAISRIKYGGYTLKEIFEKNGSGESVYVSCRVEKVCIPKKTFFIAMSQEYADKSMLCSKNCIVMPRESNQQSPKKINNQSMKVMFDEKDTPEQYKLLNNIVEYDDLWREFTDEDIYEIAKKNIVEDDSIFKVIRKQDDEVTFSSMIYYFLSKYKKNILPKFVKEVLDIDKATDSDTIVQREKNRMDISIITNEAFIIVENKIKSGINGIKDSCGENEKFKSQLSKYYQIAKEDNEKNKKNREIICRILRPQYSHLNLNAFAEGEKYIQISYKRLYEFFCEIIENGSDNFWEDSDLYYAKEFKNALYKHTTPVDGSHRNELLKRLRRRITKMGDEKNELT